MSEIATIMTYLYNIPPLGGFLYSWTVCLGHRFWILNLICNHFSLQLRCWKSVGITQFLCICIGSLALGACQQSVDISWKWISSSELALRYLELEFALGSLELALALGTCQQPVDIVESESVPLNLHLELASRHGSHLSSHNCVHTWQQGENWII